MRFCPLPASLRPEAGAPVSIAQVAGIPQPSTPPELLEGFTVSLAIATKDIVVESSKQWSEEELAWRPPWPGAVFEPKSQKHLTHTLFRQAPEGVEKIDKEVDRLDRLARSWRIEKDKLRIQKKNEEEFVAKRRKAKSEQLDRWLFEAEDSIEEYNGISGGTNTTDPAMGRLHHGVGEFPGSGGSPNSDRTAGGHSFPSPWGQNPSSSSGSARGSVYV